MLMTRLQVVNRFGSLISCGRDGAAVPRNLLWPQHLHNSSVVVFFSGSGMLMRKWLWDVSVSSWVVIKEATCLLYLSKVLPLPSTRCQTSCLHWNWKPPAWKTSKVLGVLWVATSALFRVHSDSSIRGHANGLLSTQLLTVDWLICIPMYDVYFILQGIFVLLKKKQKNLIA